MSQETQQQTTQAANPTPAPAPTLIHMDQASYAQTMGELNRLRGLEAEVTKQVEAKENERLKALAEKGQVEEAFKQAREQAERQTAELRMKAAEVEKAWLGEHLGRTVNDALAGRQFLGADPNETAAMARKLLADELESVLGPDGKPVSRHKATLQPASDWIKAQLDSPRFGVFLKADTKGGTGSGGQQQGGQAAAGGSFADQLKASLKGRYGPQQAG